MCHALSLLAPKIYDIDLSNEVLYIFVGQSTMKMWTLKVGSKEKLPSIAALWFQGPIVDHLKDLIHKKLGK